MNFNEWNNYTALGYLKVAIVDYNEIAARDENELRVLTEDEVQRLIGSMNHAFAMKTLEEAYNLG